MNEAGHGGEGSTEPAPLDLMVELRALCELAPHVSTAEGDSGSATQPGAPTRFMCGRGHGARPALQVDCEWRDEAGASRSLAVAKVRVGPWERRYVLGETEEDEEGQDLARELLDLVGAVIFGDLEVEEFAGGGATAWVMQVRGPAGEWRRCHRGGAGVWAWGLRWFGARWPGARIRRWSVGAARPEGANARWAPTRAALPWAPWAGAAGFVGGGAAAAPQPIPVDGELDLHRFAPKDVKRLMHAYIDECLARGITELRVVHGKGKGHMRRTVHATLDKHPAVASYRLAGHGRGGWGATLVELTPATAD